MNISRKEKIFGAIILLIILMGTLFYLVDGKSFSLNTPIIYLGGDETSYAAEVKMMLEENNWFESEIIGAPFGTDRTDTVSYYLFNDVHLLSFLFAKITNSVAMSVNLTFFTVVLLNAVVAYMVLINRNTNTVVAIGGAASFSLLPYVFVRGTGHLMLAAYEFVPLSLLLCLWIYEDDKLFKLQKGFFKYKRNIFAIIFAFLIANNGIGYYPVFTCFIIMITGISKAIKQRKWQGIQQAVFQCGAIVFSIVLILSRCIIRSLSNGGFGKVARNTADVERYTLKIARLFIPTFGSGIDAIDTLFQKYSESAVYQYETTEFIGYFAIIGFVILFIVFFVNVPMNTKYSNLKLLSELNITSILFATLGGFNVFLYLFVTDMVRCTNRISIFIAFTCIMAICQLLTELLEYLHKLKLKKHKVSYHAMVVSYSFFILFVLIGIKTQIKGVSLNNKEVSVDYLEDQAFIKQIENQVSENAMIYQLPYNDYPDSGFVENMYPDKLFIAYLHSDKLRWSYGARSTEKSGKWNKYVSQLEPQEMVRYLCYMGFEGIYIDSSGYKEDNFINLENELTNLLGTPDVSSDGTLLFYNIIGYTEKLKSTMGSEEWEKCVKETNLLIEG